MAHPPKSPDNGIDAPVAQPAPLWSGTGLCCEAQGDGVPCQGADGECESCGRALPLPEAAAGARRPGAAQSK